VILVLLSGIWVCGLSSLYPLVNLGKLHPLLNLFSSSLEDHTTAAPKPPRLLTHGYSIGRKSCGFSITSPGQSRLSKELWDWNPLDAHTPLECTDDHRVQFWFRSNQFDQKLPMHNKNSHCQKRDEGITSRHCGV